MVSLRGIAQVNLFADDVAAARASVRGGDVAGRFDDRAHAGIGARRGDDARVAEHAGRLLDLDGRARRGVARHRKPERVRGKAQLLVAASRHGHGRLRRGDACA